MALFFFLVIGAVAIWLLTARAGSSSAPPSTPPAPPRPARMRTPQPQAPQRVDAGAVRAPAQRPGPSLQEPPRGRPLYEPPPRWVPAGERVTVDDYEIPGGMVYVGRKMAALSEYRGMEPALIRPGLPTSSDPAAIEGATAGYWPSYSDVSPAFRARYLRWLAGGRTDPGEDVSCVFLFYYGLERRILHDAETDEAAAAEVPALLAEVERLLAIYGENHSFRGYASALLEYAAVRHALVEVDADPPTSWFGLRERLGRLAVARAPIPADAALAWLGGSGQWSPRTPAERCPEEFAAAFRTLYHERFGDGMVVKANRKRLTLEYGPASASFTGRSYRLTVDDLPDVGALTAPVDRLRQVAEAAADAIDRYSRFIGRGGDADSLAALALLPPEVLRRRVRRAPPPLVALVAGALRSDGPALLEAAALVREWPSARPDRLTRKEAEALADFLEKLGIGIAPDARQTGINLSQHPSAAVFLLPARSHAPGPELANATLLLTLAAAVAGSDEIAQREEEEIERHLEAAYELGEADGVRLRGHLEWLRACPPSTAGLKKQLEPLPAEARSEIARALIAIAGADGHVSPAEVKMLSRLYPLLGLDAQQVYADVHALAASGPATVLPAEPARDFAIPRPAGAEAAAPPAGFALDTSRIAAIQQETHEVTRVLTSVFADEEPAPPNVAVTEEEADERSTDDRLPGLDAAHSALVRALAGRDAIAAADFAALADAHGLMAGGAMESINEAAFQLCDEPLLEGTDPIEVNPFAREELFR